jgi:hypothetical protein
MLSWIFRHAARLSVIYGTSEPPELAGTRFVARPPGDGGPSARRRPLRPGEMRRTKGRCEVRPAARRVSGGL